MKRTLFLRLALVPLLATAVVGCDDDEDDDSEGSGADTGGSDAGGSDTGGTDTDDDDAEDDTEDDTTSDASPDATVDAAADATADVTTDTGATGPTLDEVHSTIFAASCAGAGCHIGAFPGAGLDLANDAGLLDRLLADSSQSELPLITPGSADDSYLYLKVTGEHTLAGGSGSRMPPAGGALPDEQIALLRDYIETTLASR